MEWLSDIINHEYMTYVLMYYIVCSLAAVALIFRAIIMMEGSYHIVDGWLVSFFKLWMVATFFPLYLYWLIKDQIKEW